MPRRRRRVRRRAAIGVAAAMLVAAGAGVWLAMSGSPGPQAKATTLAYFTVSETPNPPYDVAVEVQGATLYRPATPFLSATASVELSPGWPVPPPPTGLGWVERWTPITLPRSCAWEDYDTLLVSLSPKDGTALAAASGGLIGKRMLIVVDGEAVAAPVVQASIGAESRMSVGNFDAAWRIYDAIGE